MLLCFHTFWIAKKEKRKMVVFLTIALIKIEFNIKRIVLKTDEYKVLEETVEGGHGSCRKS